MGRSPGGLSRRGAAGCRHRCGQLVWGSDAAARSRAPCGNCSILGFWQSGQICSGRKFKCHLIGFILMLHFIFLGNGGPEVTTSNLHVTALLILRLIFCFISLSPSLFFLSPPPPAFTLTDFTVCILGSGTNHRCDGNKMQGDFMSSLLSWFPQACGFPLGSPDPWECEWTSSTCTFSACHPTVPFLYHP